LEIETAAALASDQWLCISLECVQEFLRMDCLDVREADLIRALMWWGKYQVHKDGNNPSDSRKLRSKILPALKLIRFTALTQKEFAQLCLEDLGKVMHVEERYSVLMAIVTGQWKLMPSEIATSEATPRKKPFILFQLEFKEYSYYEALYYNGYPFSNSAFELGFQLDKSADFVGLKVNAHKFGIVNLSFNVYDAVTRTIMGRNFAGEKVYFKGEEFYQITPKCTLLAGTQYRLIFQSGLGLGNDIIFSIPANKNSITSNGLTLKIDSTMMPLNFEKMLFLKSLL
jgi:hypothetical protein